MQDFFFKGDLTDASHKSLFSWSFPDALWQRWCSFRVWLSSVKLNMLHLGSACTPTRRTLLLCRLANGNVWKSGSLRKLSHVESSVKLSLILKTNSKQKRKKSPMLYTEHWTKSCKSMFASNLIYAYYSYQFLWKCKSEIVLINPENWLKPVFFSFLTFHFVLLKIFCCWDKSLWNFQFFRCQSKILIGPASAIWHLSIKYSCQVPVNYLRRNKPFAFAEPSTQLRKVNVGPNGLYKHAATATFHLVSSEDKKIQ